VFALHCITPQVQQSTIPRSFNRSIVAEEEGPSRRGEGESPPVQEPPNRSEVLSGVVDRSDLDWRLPNKDLDKIRSGHVIDLRMVVISLSLQNLVHDYDRWRGDRGLPSDVSPVSHPVPDRPDPIQYAQLNIASYRRPSVGTRRKTMRPALFPHGMFRVLGASFGECRVRRARVSDTRQFLPCVSV